MFQVDDEAPGRTNAVTHEIDTGDHRPLRQPPRRIPVHYAGQLEQMIGDMLKKSIMYPVIVEVLDSSLSYIFFHWSFLFVLLLSYNH